MARWLNVEIPQVQTSRVDLLGATLDGSFVHVELQSSNDPEMAIRMVEYAMRIYRHFRSFPKQVLLYVGDAPMRMAPSLSLPNSIEPDFAFRYTLIDIRDLNTALLLESSNIEDNLLAILTRFDDKAGMVREILRRIAELDAPARRAAFEQFLIISGLRRLAPLIRQEAEKMPILNDIMDHEVIGPAIRQGLELGLKQGRDEGRQEGRSEGRQDVVRLLLEKRFGALPKFVETRLADLSPSQLNEIALRVFDATRLEELFP